jgi:hypothetical protein
MIAQFFKADIDAANASISGRSAEILIAPRIFHITTLSLGRAASRPLGARGYAVVQKYRYLRHVGCEVNHGRC